MRLGVTLLVAITALAGCSTGSWPEASPAFTPQAQCERNGGRWHADPSYPFCEYQTDGEWPLR